MNQTTLVLILTALLSYCLATQYEDCGSTTGQVNSVEVTDCPDGQDVCVLRKGTQSDIEINFTSKADSKSLTAKVQGIILGVPIPFPLPQPDACKTGVTCPVKSGANYKYNNALDIKNSYPELSLTVRFQLRDDTGTDMACVEIPCKIESK